MQYIESNIETSHIPIILLTALNDKESIIKGLQTKADKYIVKPFDMEVLKANITNVLANREIMKSVSHNSNSMQTRYQMIRRSVWNRNFF